MNRRGSGSRPETAPRESALAESRHSLFCLGSSAGALRAANPELGRAGAIRTDRRATHSCGHPESDQRRSSWRSVQLGGVPPSAQCSYSWCSLGSMSKSKRERNLKVGRYVISGRIASGGMAAVHLGRLSGPVGFSRTVAIKRLHPAFAKDPEFVAMFLDEARLVARVRHPNVVPVLDVVAESGELFLVMEYIEGDNLSRLTKGQPATPHDVVSGVLINVLNGLHAAHEARAIGGEALDIVHRDVSPQNVLVDIDGIARVTDFGIAKASARLSNTQSGELKGKFRYMAYEQMTGGPATRRTDVYAAGAVLWELLTGRPLIKASGLLEARRLVISLEPAPPSHLGAEVSPAVDEVVLRALNRKPEERFETAADMAAALEGAMQPAMPSTIAAWVRERARGALESRSRVLEELEAATGEPNAEVLVDHVAEIAHGGTPTPLSQRHREEVTVAEGGATVPDEALTTAYLPGAPEEPAPDEGGADEPTVARTLAPKVEPIPESNAKPNADDARHAQSNGAQATASTPALMSSEHGWKKRWVPAALITLVGLAASVGLIAWVWTSLQRAPSASDTAPTAPNLGQPETAPTTGPVSATAPANDLKVLPPPPASAVESPTPPVTEAPAASSGPKISGKARTAPAPRSRPAARPTATSPKAEPSFGSFTRN